MKKNGHSTALLAPDARGWRLRVAGGEDRSLATLDEALSAAPGGAAIELALPCQSVLLERHKLPATDRGELADMLQLQLEKTLPFPVEDVSHGFEILGQQDNESTILAITAHHGQLDQICAPLRDRGRTPVKITLNALRLAAACPAGETVLALWPEQEQLVAAVIADGRLGWAQTIPSLDADTILAELPGLLMAAELEGVSTDFSSVRLSPECSHIEPALAALFQKPIQPLTEAPEPKLVLDFLPPSWESAARSRERGESLKQALLVAAVAYLLLVAGAFIYLAWMKKQGDKLNAELAGLKPKYAGIQKQEERWSALGAAVNPQRFGVEVLHLLAKNRVAAMKKTNRDPEKDDSLVFTSFTFSPREWTMKGEGTTDMHFEFTQYLKKEADLEAFDMPPPTPPYTPIPGKDDRVTFTIVGKPR